MKPSVYMLCGLPGSGKTIYSLKLQKKLGIHRFSLDEEYFAKVGNNQQKYRDFPLEQKIEEEIKTKALKFLQNGQSVIFDHCPWQKARRDKYRAWAKIHGAEVKLMYFKVNKQDLLKRLRTRNKNADKHAQFVTPQMLDDFFERFEEPAGEGEEIVQYAYAI
jgi:predicted kinase